jgi:hypothetical protein
MFLFCPLSLIKLIQAYVPFKEEFKKYEMNFHKVKLWKFNFIPFYMDFVIWDVTITLNIWQILFYKIFENWS